MIRTAVVKPLLCKQPALLAALLLVMHTGHAHELDTAVARGAATFDKYCVLCHGSQGHGDGRAAAVQTTRPADLTRSRRSDAYKAQIIRSGGGALQRSASMPPWSDVLSEAEIQDLVSYLRTLVRKPPPSKSGGAL